MKGGQAVLQPSVVVDEWPGDPFDRLVPILELVCFISASDLTKKVALPRMPSPHLPPQIGADRPDHGSIAVVPLPIQLGKRLRNVTAYIC